MEGPYREPKPLRDVIAPDRRRQRTIALVVGGMVTGALVFEGARSVIGARDERTVEMASIVARPDVNRVERATLVGPDGSQVIPAPRRRTIVHVWLQGCADCMPAFNAMRDLERSGAFDSLDAQVINVAFGEADLSWAERFGVRKNLVFDSGGASIVRPLGITTFTTLVLDASGVILHRDRPDRPGYVARVRAQVGEPAPSVALELAPGHVSAAEIETEIAKQRSVVKARCWQESPETKDRRAHAKATLTIIIGQKGDVVSSTATGDDALVASCVERQAWSWTFPAHDERSPPVQIPFVFLRE